VWLVFPGDAVCVEHPGERALHGVGEGRDRSRRHLDDGYPAGRFETGQPANIVVLEGPSTGGLLFCNGKGGVVHVSMSKFRGEIEDLPGTARMASEAMLDWLQQIDGYRGLLALVDEESGSACFVTFWENEDAVVKTRASRSSLRDQMAATAGAEVVGSEEFVVAYSDRVE